MPRLRTVLVYIATEKHVTRISRRHSFEWTVCKRKPWVNFTSFQSLFHPKFTKISQKSLFDQKPKNKEERGPVNLSKSLHAHRKKPQNLSSAGYKPGSKQSTPLNINSHNICAEFGAKPRFERIRIRG